MRVMAAMKLLWMIVDGYGYLPAITAYKWDDTFYSWGDLLVLTSDFSGHL